MSAVGWRNGLAGGILAGLICAMPATSAVAQTVAPPYTQPSAADQVTATSMPVGSATHGLREETTHHQAFWGREQHGQRSPLAPGIVAGSPIAIRIDYSPLEHPCRTRHKTEQRNGSTSGGADAIGDDRMLLADNVLVQIQKYNDKPIGVQFPPIIELTVASTEPGVRHL